MQESFLFKDIMSRGEVIGQTKIALSFTPFDIIEQLKNPDTGELFLKFKFNGEERIFSAEELASKKGVVMLAKFGVITDETKAKHLCNYMTEVRALNNIPTSEIYTQMGWKSDGSFVLGERKFTLNGIVPCKFSIHGKEVQAIKSLGDIEGWVTSVEGLLKHESQRFKIYNGVKATILYILKDQNNIVNDSGGTSQGKTITCMCATSMFGDPNGLMLAGGVTVVAAEQLATQMCDLPIHIDDIQKINKEDLDKIVYSIGNGIGKGRGAKDGGLQDTLRWRTVALFTGEDKIIKDDSFDGLDMRLLEVNGGLQKTDTQAIHDFKDGIKSHYGVFGPMLIEWLISNKDEVLKMHKESIATVKASIPGGDVMNQNIIAVQDRLIGIFAPTLTAGKIFEMLYQTIGGTKKDPAIIVTDAFKTALTDRAGESYTLRGARFILSWMAANQSYFLSNGLREADSEGNSRQYRVLGNIKAAIYKDNKMEKSGEYILIPSELKKALNDKFSVERLMDDFKKQGLLIVGHGSKYTRSSRIDGQSTKTYVLKREEFDLFAGVNMDEKNEDGKK